MLTWKKMNILFLLAFSTVQASSMHDANPENLQVLSEQDSPYVLRLSATTVKTQLTSVENLATDALPFENKVWVTSPFGVVLLERTATGLVRRASFEFETNSGAREFIVSPSGNRLLVVQGLYSGQSATKYSEFIVDNDFKVTRTEGDFGYLASNRFNDNLRVLSRRYIGRGFYLTLDRNNSALQLYDYTDDGFQKRGILKDRKYQDHVGMISVANQAEFYCSTAKREILGETIFRVSGHSTDPDNPAQVIDFELGPGLLDCNVAIFDELTNQFIAGTYDHVMIFDFDPASGKLHNMRQVSTSSVIKDLSTPMKGIFQRTDTALSNKNTYLLRSNNGYVAYQVEGIPANTNYRPWRLDLESSGIRVVKNPATNQLELWDYGTNANGVSYYALNGNSVQLLGQQKSTEVGPPPNFAGVEPVYAHNSPLMFVRTKVPGRAFEAYKVSAESGVVRQSVVHDVDLSLDQNAHFEYLTQGFYLVFTNGVGYLFKDDGAGTIRQVQKVSLGIDSYHVVVNGSSVFVQYDRNLLGYQIQNGQLATVLTASASEHPILGHVANKIFKMNGKLYIAESPAGTYYEVQLQNNTMKLLAVGSVPAVNMQDTTDAGDRIFVRNNNYLTTLRKDNAGNLVIVSQTNDPGKLSLYNNKFHFARRFFDGNLNTLRNDFVTGQWIHSPMAGCCQNHQWMYVSNGFLLTVNSDSSNPEQINVMKINSGPYLLALQPALKLNQGVPFTFNLNSIVLDDEKDTLTYSGNMPTGLTLSEAGELKYDGAVLTSGTYDVFVKDDTLHAFLTLPYSFNAAPALTQALPALSVEEGQQLNADLAGYFADPEGHVFSFSAQSQNGFSMSQNGTVAGTAASVAPTELTFTVKDSQGAVSTHKVMIAVNAKQSSGGGGGSSSLSAVLALLAVAGWRRRFLH